VEGLDDRVVPEVEAVADYADQQSIASSASRRSSPATATRAGAAPASSTAACGEPPKAAPPGSRATRAATSCSPSSPHSSSSSSASPDSPTSSATRSRTSRRADVPLAVQRSRSAVCAATMLAEIGDSRARYPSRQTLAADANQAPVAVESGKFKRARFRWACDHRLRTAIATMADSGRHHNAWAKDIYTRARARGASHTHAIPHPRPRPVRRDLATLERPHRLRRRPAHCPPTTPSLAATT
jgi:hypothetical protein